jgi:4a-hydroxytetrahydrobiopterin dehydratase
MTTPLPSGWTESGGALRRRYTLAGFSDAVSLVNAIAAEAEKADHHPDLHLTGYKRLEVVLSTHDAGGTVTGKDRALAAVIERLPRREA